MHQASQIRRVGRALGKSLLLAIPAAALIGVVQANATSQLPVPAAVPTANPTAAVPTANPTAAVPTANPTWAVPTRKPTANPTAGVPVVEPTR